MLGPNRTAPHADRTAVAFANEMAQRIAYDVREWTALKAIYTFTGDGIADRFALPANFRDLLLTSQIYPSATPTQPLRFINDTDEWLARRMIQQTTGWGEWTLIGNDMLLYPVLGAGAKRHVRLSRQELHQTVQRRLRRPVYERRR